MPHETLFQTIGLCSFISNDSKGLNYPSTIVMTYLMIVSVLNEHSDNIVIVQIIGDTFKNIDCATQCIIRS